MFRQVYPNLSNPILNQLTNARNNTRRSGINPESRFIDFYVQGSREFHEASQAKRWVSVGGTGLTTEPRNDVPRVRFGWKVDILSPTLVVAQNLRWLTPRGGAA